MSKQKNNNIIRISLAIICFVWSTEASTLTRVIGGDGVRGRIYPYQASLRVNGCHKCGGSVINNRWILTAGHCLMKYEATLITVVLGSNSLVFGGMAYRVVLGHVHPTYNKVNHTGDIGLLLTDKLIEFSENIQPISLPNCDVNDDNQANGLFTGWGNTYFNGANNDELQVIVLHVIQLSTCQKIYFNVRPEHLCTLNKPGEGICYGDSGSPLVSVDGVYQIGIASWGAPCAQGYPDVHTRIYHYLGWIKFIIAETSLL